MKITVTAKHIAKGERACCAKCPVALALRSAGFTSVAVSLDGIYLNNSFDRINTPPEAQAFIARFDATGTAEPFEFEIPDDDIAYVMARP